MKKGRILKSSSKHHIPDDIWPEILSRLPVKYLLRFRCVSRSWKIRIDDLDFARLHLNRFNDRPDSPILLLQGRHSECVIKNSETLRTISSLGFLQSDLDSVHLLRTTPARKGDDVKNWLIESSVDGLFLLRPQELCQPDLVLWNPAIRKLLPLPPLPLPVMVPGEIYPGLGFDQLNKEYKVVRLGLQRIGVRFAAVYSVNTNSWKVIDNHHAFYRWNSSIYFNGLLYGLAREYATFTRKLVSFDLSSEVFASFELPVIDHTPWSKLNLTVVDDGSLLALVHVCENKGSMWVLERLGDNTETVSWIHRYTFDTVPLHEICNYDFLCVKKNGEMLMKWFSKVICYNLETQQRKILMEKNRKSFKAASTITYIESLIMHTWTD